MNFNIYIEDELAEMVMSIAQDQGIKRNALIRRALADWVDNYHKHSGWSDTVLDFDGVKDMPPFESYRSDLLAPKDEDLF